MKLPLFIFILIISMASCNRDNCEDEEGNLTSDELYWIPYNGSEVMIFKSNLNDTDTFQVSTKKYFYNFGHNESGNSCMHHQQVVVDSIDSPNHHFILEVAHNNQWNPGGASISCGNYLPFKFTDIIPQNNILINGLVFNQVYIIKTDSTTYAATGIWRVFYTKQNGILRYDISQAEYWEKIN